MSQRPTPTSPAAETPTLASPTVADVTAAVSTALTVTPTSPRTAPPTTTTMPVSFDALPLEIRTMIYTFALRPALSPYFAHGSNMRPAWYLQRDLVQLRLSTGIDQQTALSAYFSNRTLLAHFSVPIACDYLVLRSGTFEEHPLFVQNVRKLKVRLVLRSGMDCSREMAWEMYVTQVRTLMGACKGLKELTVDFDGIPEEMEEGMLGQISEAVKGSLKVSGVRTKFDWGF